MLHGAALGGGRNAAAVVGLVVTVEEIDRRECVKFLAQIDVPLSVSGQPVAT